MNDSSLTVLLRGAGFSGDDVARMLRNIRKESGGDPNVVNSSGHVGLTQISLDAWGPYLTQVVGSSNRQVQEQWLKNPLHNLKVAKHIVDTQGWSAWVTDTGPVKGGKEGNSVANILGSGTLSNAYTAVTGDVTNPITGLLGPIRAISDVFSALLDPTTWVRILKGAGGAVFLVLGTGTIVFYFAKQVSGSTPAGAVKAAAKAIK